MKRLKILPHCDQLREQRVMRATHRLRFSRFNALTSTLRYRILRPLVWHFRRTWTLVKRHRMAVPRNRFGQYHLFNNLFWSTFRSGMPWAFFVHIRDLATYRRWLVDGDMSLVSLGEGVSADVIDYENVEGVDNLFSLTSLVLPSGKFAFATSTPNLLRGSVVGSSLSLRSTWLAIPAPSLSDLLQLYISYTRSALPSLGLFMRTVAGEARFLTVDYFF